MAGKKHPLSDEEISHSQPQEASQFLPVFENFRKELDAHHDRRERIVKASRDITALSKKIIFSLQRVRSLGQPLSPSILKNLDPFHAQIQSLYQTVSSDLQAANFHRYHRQISPSIQEFIEAISFQRYLETQSLLTYEQAQSQIPGDIFLTEDDYVLGIYDMTGEMMRFAITGMATKGVVPGAIAVDEKEGGAGATDEPNSHERGDTVDMLSDMRALRTYLEGLDMRGSGLRRDAEKKAEVMQTSVEKVERAVYGLRVRGSERPKGWMPDIGGGGGGGGGERGGTEAIESF